MRHYETMFIVSPALSEESTKAKIDFFKNAILNGGGNIEVCLDMGNRSLAYEIKKHRRGYYYVVYFTSPSSLIPELERLYRINEDIIRFIVIKYESKKEQKAWHTLVSRASGKKQDREKDSDRNGKTADVSVAEMPSSDGAPASGV